MAKKKKIGIYIVENLIHAHYIGISPKNDKNAEYSVNEIKQYIKLCGLSLDVDEGSMGYTCIIIEGRTKHISAVCPIVVEILKENYEIMVVRGEEKLAKLTK